MKAKLRLVVYLQGVTGLGRQLNSITLWGVMYNSVIFSEIDTFKFRLLKYLMEKITHNMGS